MIQGIIFDLDGTLVKLHIDEKLLKKKLQSFFKTDDELTPLIPAILHLAENNSNLIQKAFTTICDEEIKASENMELINDSISFLNILHSKNIKLCLVTMQCRAATEKILNKLKIKEIFSNVLTRDEFPERLEQLRKSLALANLKPHDAIVVGDRLHDVICADEIGCNSILIKKNIQLYEKKIPNSTKLAMDFSEAESILTELLDKQII